MFPSQKKILLALLGLAVISFSAGFLASKAISKVQNRSTTLAIREYDERYQFIRPLLICQIDEKIENKEYRSLDAEISDLIEQSKKSGEIDDSSVYFRDLNSGKWIGVNENVPYQPASLLKVPIMISYLKDAENHPEIIGKKLLYVQNPEYSNPLVSKPLLQTGNYYPVEDLIRSMIIQSDNSAKDILNANANQAVLKETYSALDIPQPTSTTTEYSISVKKFALFFRVLYNGTFLNREESNNALSLLTQVEFDKGIRAGTPEKIKIAHKYGVRAIPGLNGAYDIELSDCGIVYHSSPYLLCIMAEGNNPFKLADFIRKVAESVYRSVALD